MSNTPTLSTGQPSTLGSYLKLSTAFFGADSEATKWIEEQIAEDPDGEEAVVIADETQMVYALLTFHGRPS